MINRMVALVIIGAGLLAIATYLVITSIPKGPEPAAVDAPADTVVVEPGVITELVNVGETAVTISYVPEKQVRLVREVAAEQGALQPSPPPDNQAAEPDPTLEQPALVPTEPPIVEPQPTVAVVAPSTGAAVTFIDYIVEPGDTLYRLTEKFNTSIELMAVHDIAADHVVPGASLRIPVANSGFCGANAAYVVRPGDTVFKIARLYNTDIETLRALNNLGADYRIDIAQVLCVPPG